MHSRKKINRHHKHKTHRAKKKKFSLRRSVFRSLRKSVKRSVTMGGDAIGAGGYGCVFRPALKCKNAVQRPGKDKVSKLMTIKHSESEYNDVIKYKPILETIPDSEKYFLISGFEICEPDKLTESDMVSFQETCSRAFKEDDVTRENVNSKLKELLVLTMPDGGIDLDKFYKTERSPNELIALNSSLLMLLQKGIIPMNKLNIFHCDIKASNILVDSTWETRLIDWGLSKQYIPEEEDKSSMFSRTLQYNVPFSCLLLNSMFEKSYKTFLQTRERLTEYNILKILFSYMSKFISERGEGHIKTMTFIFKKIFKTQYDDVTDKDAEKNTSYRIILNYLKKLLLKYTTKTREFLKKELLKEVFLPTVDIWGFIISYVDLLEDPIVGEHIKYILLKYLYENESFEINTTELSHDIAKINTLLTTTATKTILTNKTLPKDKVLVYYRPMSPLSPPPSQMK